MPGRRYASQPSFQPLATQIFDSFIALFPQNFIFFPKFARHLFSKFLSFPKVSQAAISAIASKCRSLRPRHTVCLSADGIFACIFLNESVWILMNISLKFVSKGPINNVSLVQILVWYFPGYKPLSEPMLVSLLAHIYITRPQWVKFFLALIQNNLKTFEMWHLYCIIKVQYQEEQNERDKQTYNKTKKSYCCIMM